LGGILVEEEIDFVDILKKEFKRQICSGCSKRGSSCSLTNKEISKCFIGLIEGVDLVWQYIGELRADQNDIKEFINSLKKGKKMDTTFKIWINEKFIKKVSLEELAQMAGIFDKKTVFFTETKKQKFLIRFPVEEQQKILDNGIHIVRVAVIYVFYSKVNQYRRYIKYNHSTGEVVYTNEPGLAGGYELIKVVKCPDIVVEKVKEVILKQEIDKEKQSTNRNRLE
jgi:hypothetical protein